jgi:hypothetical protein
MRNIPQFMPANGSFPATLSLGGNPAPLAGRPSGRRRRAYRVIVLSLGAIAIAGSNCTVPMGRSISNDRRRLFSLRFPVSSCPQSWTRGVGDDDISLLAFARIAPLFTARIAGACGMPLGLATLVTLLACATRRMMHDRAMLLLGFAIAQA